jgi:hypothetical protein
MAFDSTTRNKLAGMIAEARELLDKEFTGQFQQIYGIQPDGTIIDIEKLKHLDEQQTDTARLLRERIEHLISGMVGERKAVVVAVERIIREQAFTILNRFTALRMCEERGFVEECVRAGMQSKGFKVYESIAGAGLGGAYERYKTFLFCQFDEIAVDLGVLFDRFSPEGLLFPREQALVGLLKIINKEELRRIWTEDETIGWVYQYFNSKEERETMRKASAAPRNSRELAVRNQFFTPRYVVEFLTDNTLGRIWYEMCRGETVLKEECLYLVRRPNEIFLAPREKAPAEEDHLEDLTQEQLLKKPFYIEYRPKKDPRDIKILDPACGSGHFLLYAFDLLETIYVEAWEDPGCPKSEATGRTLREDFTSQEELRLAISDLILRWNLHGIDIDPRCTQIASLALWLRAQKSWQKQGLKAGDRPRVTKSNIVTAEPMPGEEEIRKEFIGDLKPRLLGQLVDVVFKKMKLAGEAGPLLKIEEEIKEVVAEARRQWEKSPEMEQVALFPHLIKQHPKQEKLRFEVKEITDETFWDQAEDLILVALREYAERVENGHAMQRRLFAEDAARGFAFINLCRKRYDVALMNPPFGGAIPNVSFYLQHNYPTWNNNLLCCFFDRMLELSHLIGSVFDRTASIKTTYQEFRRTILLRGDRVQTIADLGWGVLDANVEVSTTVICSITTQSNEVFFDVASEPLEQKGKALLESCNRARSGIVSTNIFLAKPSSFLALPNAVLGFQFPQFVRKLFNRETPIAACGCRSFKGHDFKADQHFMLFWEVQSGQLGELGRSHWTWVFNGGDWMPYYHPSRDVAPYGTDGRLISSHPSVLLRNMTLQGKAGIGYGKRGQFLDAQIIGPGHAFTAEGIGAQVASENEAFYYASLFNSKLFQYIINLYCGQHKSTEYVNLFPASSLGAENKNRVIGNAQKIWELKWLWQIGDETDIVFVRPRLLNLEGRSVRERASLCIMAEETSDSELAELDHDQNMLINALYVLDDQSVALIDSFCKDRPIDRVWIEGPKDPRQKAFEHIDAFISSVVGWILGRWDLRIAMDTSLGPKIPDPFDPLPVCPPGMLVGPKVLPAKSGRIVSEEWLRSGKNAKTLPPESEVKKATILDSEYPIRISWSGFLVDDTEHPEDIINRIREVLDLVWKDKALEIEHEVCDILGVSNMRDYFRKPTGFFQNHLKRYSKSRRKAPIYWPLSTASGSYTLWVYYHRLSDQTLFRCVQDFIEPKIKEIERDIERLQKELQSSKKSIRDEVEHLVDFRRELIDFRDELLRVAKLPYKPNLNDGVMITACPLWKLFRHNAWSRDLKECWEKLESGEYDWAHLAYTIWPDRVREKCKKDRSIAIAHGLEELYEGESPKDKKQKKKKKA